MKTRMLKVIITPLKSQAKTTYLHSGVHPDISMPFQKRSIIFIRLLTKFLLVLRLEILESHWAANTMQFQKLHRKSVNHVYSIIMRRKPTLPISWKTKIRAIVEIHLSVYRSVFSFEHCFKQILLVFRSVEWRVQSIQENKRQLIHYLFINNKKKGKKITNERHHKQKNLGIMSLAASIQYLCVNLTRYHLVCGSDCSSVWYNQLNGQMTRSIYTAIATTTKNETKIQFAPLSAKVENKRNPMN